MQKLLLSFLAFAASSWPAFAFSQDAAQQPANDHASDTVNPRDCGARNNGVDDDAAALAICAAKAAAQGKTLRLTGAYGISTLSLRFDGAAPLIIQANAALVGLGPAKGQAALIDMGGAVSVSGHLKLRCRNDPAYAEAVWLHGLGDGAAQYVYADNLSFDSCLVGWRIGDIARPAAIVSEITVKGGYAYNTPVAILAEGYNTYVSFIGPSYNVTTNGWFKAHSSSQHTITALGQGRIVIEKGLKIPARGMIELRAAAAAQNYQAARVLSYDPHTGALAFEAEGGFGLGATFSAWRINPQLAGVISRGAYVAVIGGELGMPGDIGRLISLQTVEHGQTATWGRVYLHGVNSETPALLADTVKYGGQSLSCAMPGALGVFGGYGYSSQNLAPFINTTPDFCGEITVYGLGYWAAVARNYPNIAAGSDKTLISADGLGFGANFMSAGAGAAGGKIVSPLMRDALATGDVLAGADAENILRLDRALVANARVGGQSGLILTSGKKLGGVASADAERFLKITSGGAFPLMLGVNQATQWMISPLGHFQDAGTSHYVEAGLYHLTSPAPPTLSACGSAPASTPGSSNQGGQFTLGYGDPSACRVTFATPYPKAAFCSLTPASPLKGGYRLSASAKDGFTLSLDYGQSGAVFNYACTGN